MKKMSVDRGQAAWRFPPGNDMRRRDGLPRMMTISLLIHFSFFVLIMVGEHFSVRHPQLQGYQVNLVSPSAGMSSSSIVKGGGKRVRTAAAPPSSKHQAVRVSRPANVSRSPVKAIRPASRSSAPAARPKSGVKTAPQASSPAGAPRTSLKVPRNADNDPERLEEWWKKKVGSIKAPAGKTQGQTKGSLLPQRKTDKIEIRKKAPEIQIARNLTPVFPVRQGKSEGLISTSAAESQSGSVLPGEEGPSDPFSDGSLSGGGASLAQTESTQTGMIRHSGIVGNGGMGGSAGIIGGGTAGSGSSGGIFPGYLQKMENKISGEWAPPPVSFQEEPVIVTIRFNVMKNGRVDRDSIQVEKSSGNPFFDQAAMRAVYGADPFPPFPEILPKDHLSIHFNFTVLENS